MNAQPRSAAARRADLQAEAAVLGIDEAYISVLVEAFYARVRHDPNLGPVFAAAIGNDWSPHLATMKLFWSSVALNTGAYAGKPVPAHAKHLDDEGTPIREAHFAVWLRLFEETLRDTAPSEGAVRYFMTRAKRIADSLSLALFGVPGLGGQTRRHGMPRSSVSTSPRGPALSSPLVSSRKD